jgi:hypothetical protein
MARSTEQLRARFCALRKSGRSILPDPGALRARRYWLSFGSRRCQEESNDTGNHWGGAAFDLLGSTGRRQRPQLVATGTRSMCRASPLRPQDRSSRRRADRTPN